jgi:hypothetical protein
MIWSAVLGLGFVLGWAIGRWWAPALAVIPATWIWAKAEVEVPSWYLAVVYGSIAVAGIAAGVAIRKWLMSSR